MLFKFVKLGLLMFLSATVISSFFLNSSHAAHPTKIPNPDLYLTAFMSSGIDCGIVDNYDKTPGISGCSSSLDAYYVDKDEFGRPIMFGKKNFYVSVANSSLNSDKMIFDIKLICEGKFNEPKGTEYYFIPGVRFSITAGFNRNIDEAWLGQARAFVKKEFAALTACEFVKKYPKSMILHSSEKAPQVKPSPSKNSTASVKKTTPKESTVLCTINGLKVKVTGIKPSCPKKSSAIPPATEPQAVSEADKYAQIGCGVFPSAVLRLQNASPRNYGDALVALQEADFNFVLAAGKDKKYLSLNNAARIIIQYAQSQGFGGKGYIGDINTVRTALATLNTSCNSDLSIP